jgi:hypothetical protein
VEILKVRSFRLPVLVKLRECTKIKMEPPLLQVDSKYKMLNFNRRSISKKLNLNFTMLWILLLKLTQSSTPHLECNHLLQSPPMGFNRTPITFSCLSVSHHQKRMVKAFKHLALDHQRSIRLKIKEHHHIKLNHSRFSRTNKFLNIMIYRRQLL